MHQTLNDDPSEFTHLDHSLGSEKRLKLLPATKLKVDRIGVHQQSSFNSDKK